MTPRRRLSGRPPWTGSWRRSAAVKPFWRQYTSRLAISMLIRRSGARYAVPVDALAARPRRAHRPYRPRADRGSLGARRGGVPGPRLPARDDLRDSGGPLSHGEVLTHLLAAPSPAGALPGALNPGRNRPRAHHRGPGSPAGPVHLRRGAVEAIGRVAAGHAGGPGAPARHGAGPGGAPVGEHPGDDAGHRPSVPGLPLVGRLVVGELHVASDGNPRSGR